MSLEPCNNLLIGFFTGLEIVLKNLAIIGPYENAGLGQLRNHYWVADSVQTEGFVDFALVFFGVDFDGLDWGGEILGWPLADPSLFGETIEVLSTSVLGEFDLSNGASIGYLGWLNLWLDLLRSSKVE